VVAGVSMGLCRRWPAVAAGLVTVVLVVFVARRYPDGPVWVTGLIALAALSWRTSRRVALTGAAAMLAVLTGWAAAAVLGVDALRNRRNHLAGCGNAPCSPNAPGKKRPGAGSPRSGCGSPGTCTTAWRTRWRPSTSRPGAAGHVLERRPEAAGQALAVIRRAGGDVLDELAAMLAVLRDDTQQADRAPVPGAAEIPRLAESTTASGLAVALRMDGPVPAVPGVIGTAAYRVVQESLTNVLRHSRATTARVRLVADPDGGVLLEIEDDGPALPQATGGTGVGIRGMRERVVSTGGTFWSGPASGGGFGVRAVWAARP
jgi:hypothetical protein